MDSNAVPTSEISALKLRLLTVVGVIRRSKTYDVTHQKNTIFSCECILDRIHRISEHDAHQILYALTGNIIQDMFSDKKYTKLVDDLFEAVQVCVNEPNYPNRHTVSLIDNQLLHFRSSSTGFDD